MLMQLFETIRKRKGFTKYRLAKSLEISPTQLNAYIKAKVPKILEVLIKLEEIGGLSPGESLEIVKREIKPVKKKKTKPPF